MRMKHYVVLCDWAVDHLSEHGVNIAGVAHTLEEAKEIFAKAAIDERKYALDNNWKIYENTDICFDAGEEGYYASEHACLYIEEVI